MRTYTFEVDDKTYTLKYGYNAICDIEGASNGTPIQQIFGNMNEIGYLKIRLLIWGGLRYKLNGITLQQVGFICEKLEDENKIQEVVKNAFKLLLESLGKGGEETEGES